VLGLATQIQPELLMELDGKMVQSVLTGDYNFDNIMAAVAIGKYFKLSIDNIAKGITNYIPSNNRSQWIQKEQNIIFMDAYNANPSSMEASLRSFAQFNHANKLIVLGDMFEMGAFAPQEHQRMVSICEELGYRSVWLVGEEFSKTKSSTFQKFTSTADAIEQLKQYPPNQQAIFLKGSRGMKLETLTPFIP
jgi:UDP-N-acetylmuramoyl-tripeptide--D-alanyl-D-alanine ligase